MLYAIIPAAGIGSRMRSSVPKQYLPLCGSTVLLHSIRALLALPDVARLVIALNPLDPWWPQTRGQLSERELQRIVTCEGGVERWQSVQAALQLISQQSQQNDWVLVHDAVRPCVREQDLRALLDYCGAAGASTSGAILATPVSDTLKRAAVDGSVQATVDRSQLWAACTPQMFRVGELLTALNQCAQSGITVTDESSAIESTDGASGKIQLIPCHKDNIKITYPEDLQLAEWILQARLPSSFLSAGA